jgi:hypothetical protein
MYQRVDRNVREMITCNASSAGWKRLQQLLRLFSSLSKNEIELQAIECRVYGLLNQLDLFNQLVNLLDAHEWMQRGLKQGNKVYFVTGYRTFIKGRLSQHDDSDVGLSVGFQPDISALGISSGGASIQVGHSIGFSSR